MASIIDLLLLGKTGVGKSRVGNSILGRKAFASKSSTDSVTIRSKREISLLENERLLRVVDTPGLLDTRGTVEEGEAMFLRAIKEAIVMNPDGYHVFLFVLKFGNRLTQEDTRVINYLEKVFGDDFLKQYCIVLMTGGDCFKKDDEIQEASFSEWCKAQEGDFRKLVQDVGGKVILFDNFGNEDEKVSQRNELIKMIEENMPSDRRYTARMFEEARRKRDELIAQEKNSAMYSEVQDEISLTLQQIDRIKTKDINVDSKISELQNLEKRIEKNRQRLNGTKGQKSESLHKLAEDQLRQIKEEMTALELQKALNEKMKAFFMLDKMKIKKEKLEMEREEMKRKQDEEKQNKLVEMMNAIEIESHLHKERREREKLLQEKEELLRKQGELTKKNMKLNEEYQRVRDEQNSTIGSYIMSAVTWPINSIISWLKS